MKAAIGGIGAAIVASACCIGPVAFSLIGAGAVGASAVALEPYRPWFIGLTVVLVGAALYSAYRPMSDYAARRATVRRRPDVPRGSSRGRPHCSRSS